MSNNIIARPHYSIENENQYRRAIESELAKRPQLLGPNVYQGKQGGAFYDAGGAAFNPRHPKYDCKADGSTDDYARLNACFVDARAAGLPVDMGDFPYLIGTALNIADVPILGNPTIIPSGFTAEPIYADGSIGSFHDLDSNAVIGENRIECAALALLVSGGDIVKVTSTAAFSSNEPNIPQAEMKSVRNVIGDFIYFNETLLDTYTTANGAKAAIITLAIVDVRGRLIVSHSPASTSTDTRGVRFKYAHVRGRFDLYKCRGNGAAFNNCWRPDVRVDTQDTTRIGASTSYGISISNSTMYGMFRGVIAGARHCVSASGSSADGGASWENKVSVIGHGGGAAAIFDAHSNVGSIYFEHCAAIGGTDVYNLDGSVINDPLGFGTGARYTYIKDCVAIRTGVVVNQRSDGGSGSALSLVHIDGLHVIDSSSTIFNKAPDTPRIDRLDVSRVSGSMTNKEVAAINIAHGGIGEWRFRGIDVNGGRLIGVAASLTDLPADLTIDGFEVRGSSATETDEDVVGVKINAGSTVTRVRLLNGLIKDMCFAVQTFGDLEILEMSNVDFDRNLQHIMREDGVTIDHTKAVDCSFRRARHSASQGPFVSRTVGAGGYIILEVDNIEIDSDPLLVGAAGNVTTLLLGLIKGHSGMTDLCGGAPLEVLSGSLEFPRILRGADDPEGAITASVGTKYFRTSGLEYFKESGTGNTGWKTTLSGSATWNPPSLNTATQQTTTVTVTGAALGDHVESVSFSLDLQGTTLNGYVSAADTVTVVHRNDTGGTIDLANGTLRVRVKEA